MAVTRAKLVRHARTLWFMFVVTFVCISSISALDLATRAVVARNSLRTLKRAVRLAAGLPDLAVPAELDAWFARCVAGPADPRGQTGERYRVASDEGAPLADVVVGAGPGLWGTIRAAVGLSADRQSFTGFEVLEQSETPGLGARIAEPWFRQQVRGKRAPLKLVDEGTRSSHPHEVDEITGATVTTEAVRDMMNALAAVDREGVAP